MTKYIKNKYAELRIKEGILHFVYNEGISINESVAIEVVKDRLLLQQGKTFLILCDMRGVKNIDKAARNYLATEGSLLIKTVALLVNDPLTNTISEFYIKTGNLSIKTQVFYKEDDALTFLKTYNSL